MEGDQPVIGSYPPFSTVRSSAAATPAPSTSSYPTHEAGPSTLPTKAAPRKPVAKVTANAKARKPAGIQGGSQGMLGEKGVNAPTPVTVASKGSKRRRIIRACLACHSAKRRCDGTLPCENCDFAGRECVYTDVAGGNGAGLPKVKKSNPPEVTSTAPLDPLLAVSMGESLLMGGKGKGRLVRDTIEVGEMERDEYVNSFFSLLHPFQLMYDHSSFKNDLIAGLIPLYLQYAIFALSARFCPLPNNRKASTSIMKQVGSADQQERVMRCAKFAQAAREILFEENGGDSGILDSPSLAVAQALCFLAVYEAGVGKIRRGWIYLGMSTRILTELKLNITDVHPHASTVAQSITREHERRTFWVIWMVESITAAMYDRPRSFSESDLRILLPVEEDVFRRWIRGGQIKEEREFMPLSEFPNENNGQVRELGGLMRITGLFSKIMALIYDAERTRLMTTSSFTNSHPIWHSSSNAVGECERDLSRWVQSLPRDLTRFDEDGEVKSAAFMHALLEISIFFLPGDCPTTLSNRQSNSILQLRTILRSLGPEGRSSPLVALLLYVVSKWNAHVGDEDGQEVDGWWAEMTAWGLEKRTLMAMSAHEEHPVVSSVPQDRLPPSPPPQFHPRNPAFIRRTQSGQSHHLLETEPALEGRPFGIPIESLPTRRYEDSRQRYDADAPEAVAPSAATSFLYTTSSGLDTEPDLDRRLQPVENRNGFVVDREEERERSRASDSERRVEEPVMEGRPYGSPVARTDIDALRHQSRQMQFYEQPGPGPRRY